MHALWLRLRTLRVLPRSLHDGAGNSAGTTSAGDGTLQSGTSALRTWFDAADTTGRDKGKH